MCQKTPRVVQGPSPLVLKTILLLPIAITITIAIAITTAIAHCYCLLLLPIATADCYYLLLLPIAVAYYYCLQHPGFPPPRTLLDENILVCNGIPGWVGYIRHMWISISN